MKLLCDLKPTTFSSNLDQTFYCAEIMKRSSPAVRHYPTVPVLLGLIGCIVRGTTRLTSQDATAPTGHKTCWHKQEATVFLL